MSGRSPCPNAARPGVLHLEPDLLVERAGRTLVIDTKWKRLSAETASRPSNDDLYQLYAYLHRYDCKDAILLYPAVAGLQRRDLDALVGRHGANAGTVGVRFVDVSRPLWTPEGRTKLADALTVIVREGLGLAPVDKAGASP